MNLVRLIYTSKVAPSVKNDDLDDIMEKATSSNRENDVSGILVYSHKSFLQVLEGGRAEINTLYNKIVQDERHSEVTLLEYTEITERSFQDWDMKLFLETNINKTSNLKFSATDGFNPFNMSGKSAYGFLKEVSS